MKFKLREVEKGHLRSIPGGKVEEPAQPPVHHGGEEYDAGSWDEQAPEGFESNPSLEKIHGVDTGNPLDKIQGRLDNIKKALRFKLIKNEEN